MGLTAPKLRPPGYAAATQTGLAFIAGFLEAFGLIALSGLFIGHVTANIAVLGVAMATGAPGSTTKLLALPVFMAVVALTRLSIHPLRAQGHDAARLIMMLEVMLLLAFMAVGLHYGPFTRSRDWSTIVTAALGVATLAVQNSGMRLIWRTRPSTTVMTLNLTQLVLDDIAILREPNEAAAAAWERLGLVAPTLAGFLVGAACGGLGYLIAGFYGGLAPAAVLFALIFLGEETA
jgi:uncharacterized membrane protein YoaK (UPF0700 family)